jgi:hypothetical protein
MNTTTFFHRLIIVAAIAIPGPPLTRAQNWRAADSGDQITSGDGGQDSSLAWRCSLDGKAYTLESSGGLRIRPIRSGTITADIPFKLDKKGRQKMEGQWHSGVYQGLLVIQQLSEDHVGGHMLVPSPGVNPTACTSRVAAILANIGGMNQQRTQCTAVAVSWDRQRNLTIEEAAAEESFQLAAPAYSTIQPGNAYESAASPLVGTWVQESASAVNYTRIEITLRADGTYTKTLIARTPMTHGGYVGSGPSLGGTHSGTWTANGMIVNLSGDGNWPPYQHDLRLFRRQ